MRQKSPVELAFVGDAVFELLVREYIARNVDTNPRTLHNLTVSYVCADAQCAALEHLSVQLTEAETDIVRRGKNASKVTVPRNGTPRTYRSATGLEALFGYLYLSGETERIMALFEQIIVRQPLALTDAAGE